MNTIEMNDINLIESCINGERKSQKYLYDLYSPKMFTLCLRYLKNQADAEDVLQDGFIKLFNSLHSFRNEGSFEGWARRIFITTAIGQLRKKRLNIIVGEVMDNALIDKGRTPLDNLYVKDLMKSAANLTEGYRTVFTLYEIEGYSHPEVAARLGIKVGTSKSQLTRAKAKLRKGYLQ